MSPELAMSLKKDSVIECTIESLAFGGRGVARVDGMAIFVVPFFLSGFFCLISYSLFYFSLIKNQLIEELNEWIIEG